MRKIIVFIFGIVLLQLILFTCWFAYEIRHFPITSPSPSPMPLLIDETMPITRVIDGDTFVIQGVNSPKGTVRLIGVDTPEIGECFASEAAQLISSMMMNREVKVEYDVDKIDQFGRALIHLFFKDTEGKWELLSAEMLRQGIGKYYRDVVNTKNNEELLAAANEGFKNKSGLWTHCAQNKQTGCIIKGNVARDGKRYYHLPSFRHYGQTVVNFENGDMYFCSEQEAISKGWTKAVE